MLCQFQRFLYVDAEIPYRVLDLGVGEQDLDRAKITGGLVDHRSVRTPKGVRAVIFTRQPNGSDPFLDQPGVLASAEMIDMIDSAWKGIVIDCSSPSLQPGKQTCPDIDRKLELYGGVQSSAGRPSHEFELLGP